MECEKKNKKMPAFNKVKKQLRLFVVHTRMDTPMFRPTLSYSINR
jgi:hypothetical protein